MLETTILPSQSDPALITEGMNVDAVQSSFDNIQELVNRTLDNIQELVNRTLEKATAENLQNFVRTASQISLELPQLEIFLMILQKARIVSLETGFKILFLQAAALGKREQGLDYLKRSQLNSKQLALDLLASNKATKPVLEILANEGLWFTREEVSIPIIRELCSTGADISKIFVEGKPFLSWALQTKSAPFIELAIQLKAPISEELFQDKPVLEYFAQRLNLPPEFLVQAPVQIIEELRKMGLDLKRSLRIFLAYSALIEDAHILEFLFANGIDINAPLEDGATPLHIAATYPRPTLALALSACGANLLALDRQGITPLQLLLNHASPVMQALPAKFSLGFITCEQLNALIKALPATFTNENIRSIERIVSEMPLELLYTTEGMELFAQLCHVKGQSAIKIVMEKGYDLFKVQTNGLSLFSKLFLEQRHTHCLVFLLISNYLMPAMISPDGTSLLFWIAAHSYSVDLIEELAKAGVSFSQLGNEKETLLHHVVKYNPIHVQALLNQQTIDVNALDMHGRPALYYALAPIHEATVAALLQAGALPCNLGDRLLNYVNYMKQTSCIFPFMQNCKWIWRMFQNSKQTNYFTFIRSLSIKEHPPVIAFELLEISFLVPTFVPSWTKIPHEIYLQGLINLRKKYPQAPIEYFSPFLTIMVREHLQRKLPDTKLTSFEETFHLQLAILRESIIRRLSCNCPQSYQNYMQAIGQEFAIHPFQGIELETPLPPSPPEFIEKARTEFSFEYNPRTLIPWTEAFLTSQLEKNKEVIIDWFKANIPHHFSTSHIHQIRLAASAVDLLGFSPDKKKVALQKLFLRLGLEVPTREELSVEKTIRILRENEFISSFVFNEDKKTFKIAAIVFFLSRQKVLEERFSGLFDQIINYIPTQ